MEKFYEKKNLGIPVTILCVIAYLVGYLLTYDLSMGLLVAFIFATAVFSLQFDDRVKNAVKQAYIIGIIVNVIDFAFVVLGKFIELITPSAYNLDRIYNYPLKELQEEYDLNAFQNVLQYVYKYGKNIINVAVVVVFLVLIIQVLRKKDTKISFVSNMLGETASPAYQQPVQQMYQQPTRPQGQQFIQQPQGQPYIQQPQGQPYIQQPQGKPEQPSNSNVTCPNCGRVNQSGAGFCASCGAKL